MKMLDVKESLFFLSESQQEDYNKLQFYDFYFHLIRHDFLKHPYAQYSLADFWVFYYYEEVPVTNTENTLIYLFRHFLLEAVLKDSKFKRIKKSTVNASSRAMMAAALTINLFLDCLRDVIQQFDEQEVKFFSKFIYTSRELFEPRFQSYEIYPKRFVQFETKIIKSVQQYLLEHEVLLIQKKQEAVQFIDQITLVERELFDIKS